MTHLLTILFLLLACVAQGAGLGPYNPAQHAVNGFMPTQVPGLMFWLDANRITGLTNNQTCETIMDWSGYERSFTNSSSSKRPTFNLSIAAGRPVMTFDGVDDYIESQPSIALTAQSVFIAYLYKVESATYARAFSQSDAGIDYQTANHFIPLVRNGSENWGSYLGSDFRNIFTVKSNKWNVFNAMHTGQYNYNVLNGNISSNYTNTLNKTFTRFVVGKGANNLTEMLSGYISEIIVFDKELNSAKRLQVERYLGTKYGIVVK